MQYTIRLMNQAEYPRLKDFLYEAIYIPEGAAPPPKSVVELPEMQVYICGFGKREHDRAFAALVNGDIVGAVWVRIMNDYGHIDPKTPSLAIALKKPYRGCGIGTALLQKMLCDLAARGYEKVSLSVQKANAAVRLYQKLGFAIVNQNQEEYIMATALEDKNMA